eukprot:COSAG04_NODE_42_length_32379_cov_41.656691_32_plen_213_part_00
MNVVLLFSHAQRGNFFACLPPAPAHPPIPGQHDDVGAAGAAGAAVRRPRPGGNGGRAPQVRGGRRAAAAGRSGRLRHHRVGAAAGLADAVAAARQDLHAARDRRLARLLRPATDRRHLPARAGARAAAQPCPRRGARRAVQGGHVPAWPGGRAVDGGRAVARAHRGAAARLPRRQLRPPRRQLRPRGPHLPPDLDRGPGASPPPPSFLAACP